MELGRGARRQSSLKDMPKGRRHSLLDLKSFREIFPSGEKQQHKRRKDLVELYIEEAVPGEQAKRVRKSNSLTSVPSTVSEDPVLAASAPPRADPSMVLSHVSRGWEGADRSSYAAVAPRVSVAGLRVPQPARLRRGQYGVEAMEAAYSDVRQVANQLEDQLTRAFQSKDESGHGDVPMQVIRDILASNHFGVGEGELRHIMGSLMRQADVVDGQVVDFRRFLTAVRPRVWSELMTKRVGNYRTPSLSSCPPIFTTGLADPSTLPALPTSRPTASPSAQKHPSIEVDMSMLQRPDEPMSPSGVNAKGRAAKYLPTLKLEQVNAVKDVKKGNFSRDMTRHTPHVLQHNPNPGTKNKAWSLLELKRELAVAEYGVKMLNQRVREDVAWVNEHCGARTTRARKICRAYGADKMARALHKVIRRQLSQRFQQWKDTYHFSVDQDYAKRYLRFKGCHLLVSVLSGWLQREYHRALVPFKLEMERQRKEERHHAAITVQRHVRGYSFRARKRRAERASAVVRLQALTRGALARRRSIELKLKLKRDKSARVIQWRFRRFSASHFTLDKMKPSKTPKATKRTAAEEAAAQRREEKRLAREAEKQSREDEIRARKLAKQTAQEEAKRKTEEARTLKERREKEAKEASKERAATLAAAARERKERDVAAAAQKRKEEEEEEAEAAAARIQSVHRGVQTRRQVSAMRLQEQERQWLEQQQQLQQQWDWEWQQQQQQQALQEQDQDPPAEEAYAEPVESTQEEEEVPKPRSPRRPEPLDMVEIGTSMDDEFIIHPPVMSPPPRASLFSRLLNFLSPRRSAASSPVSSPSMSRGLLNRGIAFIKSLTPKSRSTTPGRQTPLARLFNFFSPKASAAKSPSGFTAPTPRTYLQEAEPFDASQVPITVTVHEAHPSAVTEPEPAEPESAPEPVAAASEETWPAVEDSTGYTAGYGWTEDPSTGYTAGYGWTEEEAPAVEQQYAEEPPADVACEEVLTMPVTSPATPVMQHQRPKNAHAQAKPAKAPHHDHVTAPNRAVVSPASSVASAAKPPRAVTPEKNRSASTERAHQRPPTAEPLQRPATAEHKPPSTPSALEHARPESPERRPHPQAQHTPQPHTPQPHTPQQQAPPQHHAPPTADKSRPPSPAPPSTPPRPPSGGSGAQASTSRPSSAEHKASTTVLHDARPPTPQDKLASTATHRPATPTEAANRPPPPRPPTAEQRPTTADKAQAETQRHHSDASVKASTPPRPASKSKDSFSKPPAAAVPSRPSTAETQQQSNVETPRRSTSIREEPSGVPWGVSGGPVTADIWQRPPTAELRDRASSGTQGGTFEKTEDSYARPSSGEKHPHLYLSEAQQDRSSRPATPPLHETASAHPQAPPQRPRTADRAKSPETPVQRPLSASLEQKQPVTAASAPPRTPEPQPQARAIASEAMQRLGAVAEEPSKPKTPEPSRPATTPTAPALLRPKTPEVHASPPVSSSAVPRPATVPETPPTKLPPPSTPTKEAAKRPTTAERPPSAKPPSSSRPTSPDLTPQRPLTSGSRPPTSQASVAAAPVVAPPSSSGQAQVLVINHDEARLSTPQSRGPTPPEKEKRPSLQAHKEESRPVTPQTAEKLPLTPQQAAVVPDNKFNLETNMQVMQQQQEAAPPVSPSTGTDKLPATPSRPTTPSGIGGLFSAFLSPKSRPSIEEPQESLSPTDRAMQLDDAKRKKKEQQEEEKRKKEEEKVRKAEEKKEKERLAEEERQAKKLKEEEDKAEKKRLAEEEKRLKKEQEEEEKRQKEAKAKADQDDLAKIEATEKRAKKEAKALQIRMALKLQRVFRGFRIRRRIAFHRVRVKELEARAAAVILKATIRIQAVMRGRQGRNLVRQRMPVLLKQKEVSEKNWEERERRRLQKEEREAAIKASQAEGGERKASASSRKLSTTVELTPEMEDRLQKLAKLEEMEQKLKERELALRQAEERMVLRSGGTVLAPVPQGEGPSAGPIDSSTQLVAYIPGSENAIVEAGGSGQLGEWIEYWDDEAQSYYYYNSVTHEASWTPPEGLMALDNSSTSGSDGTYDYQNGPLALGQEPVAAGDWTEEWDDVNQRPYWMNANTGEASWTNPLQLSGSSEALDGSQQSLDDVRSQWVSYIDENTGNEYWYNTLTGETSWEPMV